MRTPPVFPVPERLKARCSGSAKRSAWLAGLAGTVAELQQRWSLALEAPFDGPEVSCAWVARARRTDGTSAVLKLGMPHLEGEHEIAGLRFWNGDPTVRVLDADEELGAMLLESCEPGSALRSLPKREQDLVIAGLLRRLWRAPPSPHPFRLLSIDPKPFVGEPAYDATQHLFNSAARLHADPHGTIERFADTLGIDRGRLRLWMFARAAAEPGNRWKWLPLARTIAP